MGPRQSQSSTGRLDVFVRLLTERGEAFDTVPAGYRGRLYLEITQSFRGCASWRHLVSASLGRGRPTLSAAELSEYQETAPLCVWSDGTPAPVIDERSANILLSVDLQGVESRPVGYLARAAISLL